MQTSHERRGGYGGGGGKEESRERGNLLLISAFPSSGAGAAGTAAMPGGARRVARRWWLRASLRDILAPKLKPPSHTLRCYRHACRAGRPPRARCSLLTRRAPLPGAGGFPRSFSRGFLREEDAGPPGAAADGGPGARGEFLAGRRGAGEKRSPPPGPGARLAPSPH